MLPDLDELGLFAPLLFASQVYLASPIWANLGAAGDETGQTYLLCYVQLYIYMGLINIDPLLLGWGTGAAPVGLVVLSSVLDEIASSTLSPVIH